MTTEKCPKCGSGNVYISLNGVECPMQGCDNFSSKQFENTFELPSSRNLITKALEELYNEWGWPVHHDCGD